MNQIMLAAICRMIVGRHGRRIAAYGDIRTAYTQGLFSDYYQYNPIVHIQTYRKYAAGGSPYPHYLTRHYAGAGGYRRTLGDMMGIVDTCASIALLRQIQEEIHKWVTDNLPAKDAAALSRNYVNQDTNRHDIAVYLADIMHCAVTWHSTAQNKLSGKSKKCDKI